MSQKVISFQSIHQVLKAEKLFLQAGVIFDIIPTPKQMSSDCGMSIRIDSKVADMKVAESILIDNCFKYNIHLL
jgi:hypothetical protein